MCYNSYCTRQASPPAVASAREPATRLMLARKVVSQTFPESLHLITLPSRQHRAPISPLSATLTNLLASVANKRLTENLTRLDATLTKNWGLGSAAAVKLANLPTRKPEDHLRPNSFAHTFLATPHPLNPLLSHSYKNHGGGGSSFFHFSPITEHGSRFHRLPHARANATI
jgi:hypothetical protein